MGVGGGVQPGVCCENGARRSGWLAWCVGWCDGGLVGRLCV